jgi:DnaJ-class molecular chaperone
VRTANLREGIIPTSTPANKDAEEKFKEISVAHDALSDRTDANSTMNLAKQVSAGFDADKARTYRQRQDQSARAGGGYEFNVDDLGDLFGMGNVLGRGRRGRSGSMRGQDIDAAMKSTSWTHATTV